ncbi:MAG: PQQ-binding-like beta-propeller repeat protein, partial [Candidatus Margulisiibacteriota bacterium]
PIYFIHQGIETIIYGTGGERKDGHLVAQNAQTGALLWQIPSKSKGIISSPILYMENNQPFVVSNSMGGEVWKVNALSGELAWHKVIGAEYETYSSPAVIQRDDRIDIVSVFAYGVWPKYSSASLFILDGHTGQVNFRKPLGRCNSASSPLIADMDNDNREDILVITCVDRRSRLLILDHDYDEMIAYPLTSGGYSTPVISDMDQDSNLDILVPRFHFMNRFEMVAPFTSGIPLNWNQYRGRNWSGQRLEN